MAAESHRAGWERVPYPFPVGTKVEGVDAAGQRFAGTVDAIIGPYSVRVDGVGTPVSMITTVPNTAPISAAVTGDELDYFEGN